MNDVSVKIDLGQSSAKKIRAWWHDLRTGVGTLLGEMDGGGQKEIKTPPNGSDWVLVLDDVEKNYVPPGLKTGFSNREAAK